MPIIYNKLDAAPIVLFVAVMLAGRENAIHKGQLLQIFRNFKMICFCFKNILYNMEWNMNDDGTEREGLKCSLMDKVTDGGPKNQRFESRS